MIQSSTPPIDELRGVSVHYLTVNFLYEVTTAGLNRNTSIRDVETAILLRNTAASKSREDGQMGSAYVDLLWRGDLVGVATHILSHTSDSTIGEIVDALGQYCSDAHLSPKQTYIWLPCFCVNLHRQKGLARETSEPQRVDALREEIIRRMKR